MTDDHQRLGVFRSDSGITLSFGQATYFISADEPFHNIAVKALEMNDFVPFYHGDCRGRGGAEFRDALERMIRRPSLAISLLVEGFSLGGGENTESSSVLT